MKEIHVQITRKSEKVTTWEGGFNFPSPEMAQAFFAVVGNGDNARFQSHVVAAYSHWKAWDAMRDAGWIHDGFVGDDHFLRWCLPETDAEMLELCLKHHDWYYQYSDDHRVWQAGRSAYARIQSLMAKVGEPLATELFNRYCPKEQ